MEISSEIEKKTKAFIRDVKDNYQKYNAEYFRDKYPEMEMSIEIIQFMIDNKGDINESNMVEYYDVLYDERDISDFFYDRNCEMLEQDVFICDELSRFARWLKNQSPKPPMPECYIKFNGLARVARNQMISTYDRPDQSFMVYMKILSLKLLEDKSRAKHLLSGITYWFGGERANLVKNRNKSN